MEFGEFKNYIYEKVCEKLGDEYEVNLLPTTKNNGVKLTGISAARKGSNIAPTLYVEHFYENYENGVSMQEVMGALIKTFREETPCFDINMDDICVYEKIKNRIYCKVVNYKKNEKMILETPHIKQMDLCILFYCLVGASKYGDGTILINNRIMDEWGISVERLYEDALINTKREYGFEIMDIRKVLQEMYLKGYSGSKEEMENLFNCMFGDEDAPMYVLSNKERYYGATCLLFTDELLKFAKKLNSNLFILPSSIHEVIIVPDKGNVRSEDLLAMVREINATELREGDILSDNVYKYTCDEKCLTGVCSA